MSSMSEPAVDADRDVMIPVEKDQRLLAKNDKGRVAFIN
jgi:hypothetical protein